MAQLSVNVPHVLSQTEAARRFKERLAAGKAEYRDQLSEFHEQWQDHTLSFAFRAMGLAISGNIAVEPGKVRLQASLPLAVMVFKSTIEKRILQEIGELLAVSPGAANG
jgi:hypothetical protein